MKNVTEQGKISYKYKVFGWYVTISNAPVKFRQTNNSHGVKNSQLRTDRRHLAQNKCERCDRPLSIYGRIHHILPAGDPERNNVENVRFLCNSCFRAVHYNGAPLELPESPMCETAQAEKGGEA